MILSVSRRTDIPAFYLDWFLNRLEAGWLMFRNPFNQASVSRVEFTPESIECIAFWTKNPGPMLERLGQLAPYHYFVQVTLNPYGPDMEAHLPPLSQRLADCKALALKLGPERMVWRYSPVVLNDKYNVDFHLKSFAAIAGQLEGHTRQCRLSFLDLYPKIKKRMQALGVYERDSLELSGLARKLAEIAHSYGIAVSSCGKFAGAGIECSGCIEGRLIENITGKKMVFKKDPGQKAECGCVQSIDVGSYQTCLNGCRYCYANYSHESASRKAALYAPDSPLLCDALRKNDIVHNRKTARHQLAEQTPLFSR